MGSHNCSDSYTTKTRLQETTEKRKIEEVIKRKSEFKRQKKMFAPREVNGPRDILVNCNLPKLEMEKDVKESLNVKQESLEVKSTEEEPPQDDHNCSLAQVKLEDDDKSVFKVENTLDLGGFTFTFTINEHDVPVEQNEVVAIEVEQNTKLADNSNDNKVTKIVSESGNAQFLQNRVQLLKQLVNQKDKEMSLLNKKVSGSSPNNSHSIQELGNIASSSSSVDSGSSSTQIVTQLTSDLKGEDANIKTLSEELTHPSFEKVLPFLYPDLQLSDLLKCRQTCPSWQAAVDTFLETHPTLFPFDSETQLQEERKLELGRTPTWTVSPLQKLAKAYTFSGSRQLDTFTKKRKGKIIGSTISLDNINIHINLAVNVLNRFFTTFATDIQYLQLSLSVELPDLKLLLLIDRVKLCLEQLPSLVGFTLVFDDGSRRFKTKLRWRKALESQIHEYWLRFCLYPKVENLKSLVIDVVDLRHGAQFFLNVFAKSLIMSYSKQLKRICLLTKGYCDLAYLDVPNIVELTMPLNLLDSEFVYDNVQKCTLIDQVHVLKHADVLDIQKILPNLVFLGFNFESSGGIFHPCKYTPSTLIFSNVLTLQLENCGAVAFNLLCLFPKLRYLKLKNSPPFRYPWEKSKILDIMKLCKGESLYKSKAFWDQFQTISSVTLDFISKLGPDYNTHSLLCSWTREGYLKYGANNEECTELHDLVENHTENTRRDMPVEKIDRHCSQRKTLVWLVRQ